MEVSPGPSASPHDALLYPLGDVAPDFGEMIPLADGYVWTRFDAGPLGAINVWLIGDADDLSAVDTGLATPASRAGWERLILALGASEMTIRRLLLTHHHPDHSGLAAWVAERLKAPVFMPVVEQGLGRQLTLDLAAGVGETDIAFWRQSGWTPDEMEEGRATAHEHLLDVTEPLPDGCLPLEGGDTLSGGVGRSLTVITTHGHTPAHACLWDERSKVLVTGDQVLPEMTSGLAVAARNPDADLLGEWRTSSRRLRMLPEDTLVLPAHGRPFYGLHTRLDQLEALYQRRLGRLEAHLASSRSTAACIPALFASQVEGALRPIATGEARAYLNRLEREGRVRRSLDDGVIMWRATGGER